MLSCLGEAKDALDNSSQDNNNNAKLSETVPNPPNFFDADIEKWKQKFSESIKERHLVKAKMSKTQYITPLT